ncbi:hypothetical protein M0R45_021667 [Rubus argutus]|uniref:Uncharacterized protein n=1 Tax=Rubus argutus TaxID=59490 RepID=A0AAW1XCZ8_RUBAR
MRGDGSHDCCDGQTNCCVVVEIDVVAVSWESAKRDQEHPEQIWTICYYDNQDASSTTFRVISTISSDTHLIQDTIAEKIPNFLAQFASFLISIPVAFLLSW